jgi:hypothetical protein
MSPIGLMMVVINLSPTVNRVEGKAVFEYTEASHVLGVFSETRQLSYSIRPMPRPP